MSNILYLEDNLNNLENFYNYDKVIMNGCIFEPLLSNYYLKCNECGLDPHSRYHEILFDLNTRFLKNAKNHISNQKLGRIIDDGVYPGKFEINILDYNAIYSENDYLQVVNDKINNH